MLAGTQNQELTVSAGGGSTILVRDVGPRDAPTVVLVHGLGADGLVWSRQMDELSRDLRVLVVDIRGHGRSGTGAETRLSESSTWADDIAAVLEQADADRPVLVGWSYGALAVADYVDAYGTGELAGIALVAPLRKVGTEDAFDLLAGEFLEIVPGLLSPDLPESVAAASTFVDMIPGKAWSDSEKWERLGAFLTVSPSVRSAMFSRSRDSDATWSSVEVPMLLIYGTDDKIVTADSTRGLSELVPGAEVSEYAGAGHSPFTDDPERFNSELLEFVSRAR